MKRTGPTNPILQDLIRELKKASIEQNVAIWKRVATDLEKSTRSRRIVNLSKINRYTEDNEIIVVPGKVLGSGELNHKISVSALKFSESALEKLNKIGAKVIPLIDLIKENPKGKKIRIIG